MMQFVEGESRCRAPSSQELPPMVFILAHDKIWDVKLSIIISSAKASARLSPVAKVVVET